MDSPTCHKPYTTNCERKGHMEQCEEHLDRAMPGKDCKSCGEVDAANARREEKNRKKAAAISKEENSDWNRFQNAPMSRKPRQKKVNQDF